ncbi:MAG: DUF2652 domain-containing protein [Dehalococcoidia bacterium]
MSNSGTFVLADIGGYTAFLSEVGIEHAKEITSHLFNGMVKVNRRRWNVGNVEGDCLFLYTDSGESPDNFFAHLRGLYEDFRNSIAEIASGSTCRCGACDRSGDLALKFVVHAGEFDTHEIAGREELIGPDVVVAHRLLKNSVPLREYALLTTPLADVAQASGLPAEPGRDEYQDIGAVEYVYLDLQPVREEFDKSREVYISEEDAVVAVVVEIDAPPEIVWSASVNFDKVPQWAPTLLELESLSGEEGKVGEVHTCLHGSGVKMVHRIVAVDEATRRQTERLWNVPFVKEAYFTFEARPSSSGTRAGVYYGFKHNIPIAARIAMPIFLRTMKRHAEADMEGLKAFCEAEAREATETAQDGT